MHYRTARISFLETADAFLELSADVQRLPGPAFQTGELSANGGPVTLVRPPREGERVNRERKDRR